MTDKPVLRLGFIGLGQAVNRIFEQYADVFSLPYKITAAADTRQQALGRFRQQFGGETYTTAEELRRHAAGAPPSARDSGRAEWQTRHLREAVGAFAGGL
jgi:hypothetical protein